MPDNGDPGVRASDFRAVARLHKESITTGFLSTLGEGFLARLYKAIASHPDSCVLVERNEAGEVLGFVSGSLSVRACYSFVLRRYFFSLGLLLLPKLFSLSRIKRILETLLYPSRSAVVEPAETTAGGELETELLSMAVSDRARGKGLGKKLVTQLEAWLKAKGYSGAYKVVTYAPDEQSNGFYKSADFTFHHSFELHGNKMNEYRKMI